MISGEQIKACSDKIINLLPDDTMEAVTVLALNYAVVASVVGLDDDTALEAVRRALRQVRQVRANGVGGMDS
jgi:hypothetical protein